MAETYIGLSDAALAVLEQYRVNPVKVRMTRTHADGRVDTTEFTQYEPSYTEQDFRRHDLSSIWYTTYTLADGRVLREQTQIDVTVDSVGTFYFTWFGPEYPELAWTDEARKATLWERGV